MRKFLTAVLAAAACLGGAAAVAPAAQASDWIFAYTPAGYQTAWAAATNQCLAQFPSTCHSISLPYADNQCYYYGGCGRWYFRFYGYWGSTRVACYYAITVADSGRYLGQWAQYTCLVGG